jgi:hypothetical protein
MTSMVSPCATMIAVPPSQLQGLEELVGFRGTAEPVISGGTGAAG